MFGRKSISILIFIFFKLNLFAQQTKFLNNISVLDNLSSMEIVRLMGLGWNLGNTLEACGDWIRGSKVSDFETAWGSPETTKEMIDKIKIAGFNSVRIPVAWSNLMEDDYTISPFLLRRVKEIVDWVLANNMFALVNIHWDGGWWSKFPTEYEECMRKYTRIWTQISEYFKDYPLLLIFESLNEEGCFNDVWNRWGSGTFEQKRRAYEILNSINQRFVDIVRNSGGVNSKRHLLIAGYCTDIDLTVDTNFKIPNDPQNRCIVSVHYYTPWVFAGLTKDEWWGKARPTWGTPEDYAELNTNIQKLKTRFLDNNIPVIVGEYGATEQNKDYKSVRKYILTVAEKFYQVGICPMLWDANQHFDRRKLEWKDPELIMGFRKILRTTKRN
jgi:endoglucanase